MTDFVKSYLDLLIFQYQDKPKIRAELELLVGKFEDVKKLDDSLPIAFDIDKAVGKQLDVIGRIVGLPRKTDNVIPKVYFGFYDENSNAVGFGDGAFYTFESEQYSDLELNDTDYRFFLKAKISINFMKNNIHKINDIISFLFSNNAYVEDNRDTTFTLWVNENVDLRLVQYAKSLNLLPRPQTISYNLARFYEENATFGFYDQNPNSKGFGEGGFAQILDF